MKLRIYFQIVLQEAILPSGLGCPLCPPYLVVGEPAPVTQTPACCMGRAGRQVTPSHKAESPSLPQSSEPCGAFRREGELTVPGPGVWTEICSSHSRMGKSGCIRDRRPPQCHRGDLPCVPRVRRGCERAVLCGVVCRTFSWAHRPAHWSSAHRHLHGHPARVPAELGLPRGAALTSVGVGRGSAQNKRVGRHLAMSQHSNLVLQKS